MILINIILNQYVIMARVILVSPWSSIWKVNRVPGMWHKCDASFSEGFAQVRKDFKYGYIDKSGKLVMRILFYGTGSRYKIILCSLNTANTNDMNDSPSATSIFFYIPLHPQKAYSLVYNQVKSKLICNCLQ